MRNRVKIGLLLALLLALTGCGRSSYDAEAAASILSEEESITDRGESIAAADKSVTSAGGSTAPAEGSITADSSKIKEAPDLDQKQPDSELLYIAEKSDFTIWKGTEGISLYDREDAVNLSGILGEPDSEGTEQLGIGADTYCGSFVKELSYDGIKLRLFSPQEDKKGFWIFEIVATGGEFVTSKGIKAGSSISELKKQYPNIEMLKDGRDDENNCAYVAAFDEEFSYLTFEAENSRIIEIKMLVEFP
ncbi:MAG: hypothetical protein ABFD25_18185 [Clostridiaceae bacterium]